MMHCPLTSGRLIIQKARRIHELRNHWQIDSRNAGNHPGTQPIPRHEPYQTPLPDETPIMAQEGNRSHGERRGNVQCKIGPILSR